jgi:hypothetical protein
MVGVAPVPHSRIRRTRAASGRGRPPSSYVERGVAVDTIQGTLGQLLLVLVALAVVLFTLILVLIEADYILRLGRRLVRRWKSGGLESNRSDQSAVSHRDAERPPQQRAAR